MAALILVTVLLQVCLAFVAADDRCHGKYSCPQYEILEKNKDYEVRRYPTYKFAQSRVTGASYFIASNVNFMRLFHYIFGHNDEGKRVPMTVPVLTPIEQDEDGDFKKDFAMMFWLPEKYQCEGCAPTPKKNDVEIVTVEEKIVYVRTFSWYTYETSIKFNEMKLKASLEKAGLVAGEDFEDKKMIVATYNEPTHVFGRTNEVMFVKKADN